MTKQINSIKCNVRKGFTLIEFMIVVAVIAVLASFALPSYHDYTIRTRVAEGLALASSAKIAITEYYNSKHAWPLDNASAGMVPPSGISGSAVSSVKVKPYMIEVTYKSNVGAAGANMITFIAPSAPAVGQSVTWKCGGAGTTVPIQYLPPECR